MFISVLERIGTNKRQKQSGIDLSNTPKKQLPGPCDCDAYGNTIVYEAAGAGGDWFADDARSIYSEDPAGSCCPTCEFIFTGRRFDPETSDATTQMYFYRARYYRRPLFTPTCRRFGASVDFLLLCVVLRPRRGRC